MAAIGFVGLGHMGLHMATNLVRKGHTVTGFDLQSSALEQFKQNGGVIAQHLADAALEQDIIITMLQTGTQVETVCCAKDGLYAHANQNTLHIDCSTIDVPTAKKIHQAAADHHMMMLDAPVSGGVAGAAAGTLTFMVGGQPEICQHAKPILSLMGKKIIYTGDAGSGQSAKICNNMILGINMIAVSEAFLLAEQLGLNKQKLFEVLSASSGQSWVVDHYLPVPDVLEHVPANQGYPAGFSAAMMLKDLRLSQASAEFTHTKTPIAALATQMYQQFNDNNQGHLDFSAIILNLMSESS